MATVQVNARIDRALKDALDRYCRKHGVVLNHFIQETILDRLEELEHIEDLKGIRHEPARPFADQDRHRPIYHHLPAGAANLTHGMRRAQ